MSGGYHVGVLGMAVVITGSAVWALGRVRGDFGIRMRWAKVRVAKEGYLKLLGQTLKWHMS